MTGFFRRFDTFGTLTSAIGFAWTSISSHRIAAFIRHIMTDLMCPFVFGAHFIPFSHCSTANGLTSRIG
jgi:hypothetical protein